MTFRKVLANNQNSFTLIFRENMEVYRLQINYFEYSAYCQLTSALDMIGLRKKREENLMIIPLLRNGLEIISKAAYDVGGGITRDSTTGVKSRNSCYLLRKVKVILYKIWGQSPRGVKALIHIGTDIIFQKNN